MKKIRILHYSLCMIILLLLGFYTKLYSGQFSSVVNNQLGGLFYVIFGVLLLSLIIPNLTKQSYAIIAFLLTTLLEVMQLWHPIFLETIRSTFIGKIILGNSFNWKDIPWYFLGAIIGYIWLVFFDRQIKKAA